MAMRITTNSMVMNYNSSLSSTLNTLNRSRERLESNAKFNRAYEDPTSAMRASSLTRRYLQTEDYLSTVENASSRQDSADAVIQEMLTMTANAVNDEGLRAITDTSSPDVRKTYATSLRQMQQSLAQLANSQYGGSYIFAGADGKNMPFEISSDGTVKYRGIDVTNGDNGDFTKLDSLLKEKLYIDVGIGMQIDGGKKIADNSNDINGASAIDVSMPGIAFLGYGTAAGDPPINKNVIALVGQMADALEKPDFNADYFNQLRTQLTKTHSNMTDFDANVGVKSTFLETTKNRLETDKLNIYTQLDSVQNINPAEAIMDYSYSQYAYNMVLKVGTSLLTNSFIDFMK